MQWDLRSSGIMSQKLSYCTAGLFSLAVCAALAIGWRSREAGLTTAEYGTGHMLGILGTSFMLALLIYPARKRIPALAAIGSIKMWFRIHMIFGILGPVCILFHASFHMGSLNSSVALFTMLAIAVSGIFGRYVYCKIHDGLHGRRITMLEFSARLSNEKEEVGKRFAPVPGVKEELCSVTEEVLSPCTSLLKSIRLVFSIRYRNRFVLRRIKHKVNAYVKQNAMSNDRMHDMRRGMQRQLILQAELFLEQIVTVAHFVFFERLFALWQVLHIPSTYILALVILMHVIAVSLF